MQERGWDKLEKSKQGDLKKVYGMLKSIREGNFSHNGWPSGHVLSILWGSSNKLLTAMGHDTMCGTRIIPGPTILISRLVQCVHIRSAFGGVR